MASPIREYIVKIHWRGLGSRRNRKGYSIIARSPEDARQFALFRFARSHPGHYEVDEIEATVVRDWRAEAADG